MLPADLKNWDLKSSDTNWQDVSHFCITEKIFTLLICPILYKYNYEIVSSSSWTLASDVLSKLDNCKFYLTSDNYGNIIIH